MNTCQKIENLNVAVVTHVFATGPAQELEGYLKDKVKYLFFIGHPFRYAFPRYSFFRVYDGKKNNYSRAIDWRLPELFTYLKDFFYTLIWILRSGKKFDVYIGADCLNAFAGVILKKIGVAKRTIFYTVDYAPKRFKNGFLNSIYLFLDKLCVNNCDYVWNLSGRMIEARKENGVKRTDNQMIVPIGVSSKKISLPEINDINRFQIVYLGHLRKFQGLELVIESMPQLILKYPQIKLVIVGTGELEFFLRKRVGELKLEDNVEFKGYIEDHKEVEEFLSRCALGLALYEPHPNSFTRYSDPSKPKQYMSCGLPVIITRVPWIAKEIEDRRCGLVVNYNNEEFVSAVLSLIGEVKKIDEFRQNAIKYAATMRWDNIFEEALEKVVS